MRCQAPSGFEPLNEAFAELSLTTWVRRRVSRHNHQSYCGGTGYRLRLDRMLAYTNTLRFSFVSASPGTILATLWWLLRSGNSTGPNRARWSAKVNIQKTPGGVQRIRAIGHRRSFCVAITKAMRSSRSTPAPWAPSAMSWRSTWAAKPGFLSFFLTELTSMPTYFSGRTRLQA